MFMSNLNGATKKKGAKLPLTLEQYKKIREVIRTGNSRYKKRNLLLINVQANTSLRSCDVLKMKVGDVYRDGRFIKNFWIEQKKTKKQTAVIVLDCILKDLREAKKEYDEKLCVNYFDNPDFALFPSEWRGYREFKPISYSSYFMMLKKWVKQIGLNPDLYGTHSLRASIPLDYFRTTGDLATTSKLFGHSQISTTSIYINEIAKEKASQVRESFNFSD